VLEKSDRCDLLDFSRRIRPSDESISYCPAQKSRTLPPAGGRVLDFAIIWVLILTIIQHRCHCLTPYREQKFSARNIGTTTCWARRTDIALAESFIYFIRPKTRPPAPYPRLLPPIILLIEIEFISTISGMSVVGAPTILHTTTSLLSPVIVYVTLCFTDR
jgi:hypothetical protein